MEFLKFGNKIASESEEWSSQLIFQFKQLERRSLKKSGLQRDSNPWPPQYQCDALPTELWSHILGARTIYGVHIFPWGGHIWIISHKLHIISLLTGRYELNKLTSLPMCGFIAQLVEHRTGIAEVTGSNPVEALLFTEGMKFRNLELGVYRQWRVCL